MAVRGVQFVTDSNGQKVAVLLDLKEWGELWEDIYDNMIADERAGESSMPLAEFEAELRAEGLLNE
jgi:PHD/YefM family antitoxin component YafN of YafNO toxin-antitoxin module